MVRHKVFISYHHAYDQAYKDFFVNSFQYCFIDKSVHAGEYEEDLSTDYIKRLIREEKITDSSIVIVLIGTETYKRKHVDWEISAGLTCQAGGCSGLIGILLPSYYLSPQNYPLIRTNYLHDTIPPRLSDNIMTGYADIYNWESLWQSDMYGNPVLINWLNRAYQKKINYTDKISNNRLQFKHNRI